MDIHEIERAETMDANLRAYGFNRELQRHRDNARRELASAKRHLDNLLANFDNETPSSLLAHNARQLNASAAEFWAETQAMLALHEVRFLVDDEPES